MSRVANSPSSPRDAGSVDPKNSQAWNEAKAQAAALGIAWERPKDDKRSAEEIIRDSDLLKNLGNQSGVRDALELRVGGDIDKDADAAFRAEQVLMHIEQLDSKGQRTTGNDVGNNEINGFAASGDAKPGTEAGRLQDFGKEGFRSLKGKLPELTKSEAGSNKDARDRAAALGIVWERPKGVEDSAQQIIKDNPILANLGNQSNIREMLQEQVGDFEKDADAAFRAAQVLEHIQTYDAEGNGAKGTIDDRIDGFTSSGEAKNGTEAGRLQDFGKVGFEALKGELDNKTVSSLDKKKEKERLDAVNRERKDAGLAPIEKLDVASLETTEKNKDGKVLTVTELAWQNTLADWKKGMDSGKIKADDDRAKLYNALKAGSVISDGAEVYGLSMSSGVAVIPANGRDFKDIIDAGKVDKAIETLMKSKVVEKDITSARKDALGKVPDSKKIVDDLKKMAFGKDYALHIQKLTKDGKKDIAKDDIAATYGSLLAADPEEAAKFAKNMQLNAMTMELDALMANPSMIGAENLTQAGQDIGKLFLTLIKKGGLDLGRRLAESEGFFREVVRDKKTAEQFSAAMQEIGAQYAKTGKITTEDVDRLIGKGKYTSLEGSTFRKAFLDMTKAGVIGSLGGTVSLVSGIYRLAGKGGKLADTPEERLAIAKDFVAFIGAGKHFGDLANHIIGNDNMVIKAQNEKLDQRFDAGEITAEERDKLKKTATKPLLGLGATLDDLVKAPKLDKGKGNAVVADVDRFANDFDAALEGSKHADRHKNIIQDLTDADYFKLLKGLAEGYEVKPGVVDADGKRAPGWQRGASAALLVMNAGAETFLGAADVAIGALTIKKGQASGDNVTVSKGALQVAAGGFGLVGGVSSAMGLSKALSFAKVAAAPSFVVSAIIQLATTVPDIINDNKRTREIEGYRTDMQKFFKELESQGLLVENGLDKYRFLEAYMTSYGQRDAPDGISIFDYRQGEVDYFLQSWQAKDSGKKMVGEKNDDSFTSTFALDENNHQDYRGDGNNLVTKLKDK